MKLSNINNKKKREVQKRAENIWVNIFHLIKMKHLLRIADLHYMTCKFSRGPGWLNELGSWIT
jgi:hypothetical protein